MLHRVKKCFDGSVSPYVHTKCSYEATLFNESTITMSVSSNEESYILHIHLLGIGRTTRRGHLGSKENDLERASGGRLLLGNDRCAGPSGSIR